MALILVDQAEDYLLPNGYCAFFCYEFRRKGNLNNFLSHLANPACHNGEIEFTINFNEQIVANEQEDVYILDVHSVHF